MKNENMQTLF